MSVVPLKIIATTNLTTSAVGYGSAVGTGATQVIKRAIFSNYSGASVTITVNVVAGGGSATTSNQVIDAVSIAAGSTYVSPELSGMTLVAGDQIFALASANSSVNMTVSGIQFTSS